MLRREASNDFELDDDKTAAAFVPLAVMVAYRESVFGIVRRIIVGDARTVAPSLVHPVFVVV